MAIVTFEIEFTGGDDVVIRLPHGRGQQRNAAKVAKLTEKLAKLLGRVKERHIGGHDHHHGGHTHDTVDA